jgi:hypothetical protein
MEISLLETGNLVKIVTFSGNQLIFNLSDLKMTSDKQISVKKR